MGNTLRKGDLAKINETGKLVKIVDVWAIGFEVLCRVVDEEENTSTVAMKDLRRCS